jgi:hypothetical protein
MLAAAIVVLAAPAWAQSNVDEVLKFAWGENVGWTNWRDANATNQGVRVNVDFLEGYIWAENVGWINVGDGGPYANTDDTDFGVNVDTNGDLFGLAWGENVGWINFDTRAALTAFDQQARFDLLAGRFRGYAWGENVGWINLDDAEHYVAAEVCPACVGDLDGDDVVDLTDFGLFAAAFNTVLGDADYNPCADLDHDGVIDLTDFTAFGGVYGEPCP